MLFVLASFAVSMACSTTKRLAEGEVLYTGVRKIQIETDTSGKLVPGAEGAVKAPLSVKPNNPLFSPYVRTPLPIGLWAWNYLYTDKPGLRRWLYRRLAKEPVLISRVQPEVRVKVVEDILDNYGYFGSSASYELLPKRNSKKARLSYFVQVARPWFYDSIAFPQPIGSISRQIDSLRPQTLLRVGAQYNVDTLAAERQRLSGVLRNRGYYFFRPDYIGYLADTTRERERIDLRMILKPDIPEVALRPYSVGNVTVQMSNIKPGRQDTMMLGDKRLIYQHPLRIRPRLLARMLPLERGETFTLDDQNKTQNNLTKLGIFRSVNLTVTPPDSLRGSDSLDVLITAAFDYPLEAELEMDVVSKSNSFLGPGLTLKLSNNNLFHGGERLSLHLNGSYEWQTGSRGDAGNRSLLNSYEFGIDAMLTVPKRLFPGYFNRVTEFPSNTRFQLGADLMNRPRFFRIASFSGSLNYDMQSSAYSYHNLSFLKLVYNNLLHTSEEFDKTMEDNPAIALSFKDQFIPSIVYTYTYDRPLGNNRAYLQTSFTSAGNLIYAVMELAGHKGPKNLFGNRFSQFVKGTVEFKYYQRAGEHNMMVYRVLCGAEHAYANSSVVPYSEQFYIGGANSIRAFTIRSIGPGGYYPAGSDRYAYLDQTGTFKLEANLEFRFGIFGRLNGAVFLDAGNIWLLQPDPNRPDADLTWKGFGRQIALGTGFGLRYDISYLVIRADLGIALHDPYNTGKKGYYNITSFHKGLGFHLAIGYPF